ncbi:MAG: heme exporter protein CcmD [Candidatus Competibacteraceae bacterium]|nr:heme exporter protein CcmD [Candidatus Competibacteraceae bacterium]
MSELKEFFHMGGYALYVWPSYVLAVVVLALNGLAPRWRRRWLINDLARRAKLRRRASR